MCFFLKEMKFQNVFNWTHHAPWGASNYSKQPLLWEASLSQMEEASDEREGSWAQKVDSMCPGIPPQTETEANPQLKPASCSASYSDPVLLSPFPLTRGHFSKMSPE